jgi:hypothetical protein
VDTGFSEKDMRQSTNLERTNDAAAVKQSLYGTAAQRLP